MKRKDFLHHRGHRRYIKNSSYRNSVQSIIMAIPAGRYLKQSFPLTLLCSPTDENALPFLSKDVLCHLQIQSGTTDRCVHADQSGSVLSGFPRAVLFPDKSVLDSFDWSLR